MLVVVKDGNIQELFQTFFDLKAAGCTDVFEIDTAERGSDIDDCADDFFRVLCVQADRHGIDAAEFLKENGFSFHNRHSGIGTDIAKAQYSASVGDDGHGIGLDCILISGLAVCGDHFTWLCHTGCIGKRQRFPGING